MSSWVYWQPLTRPVREVYSVYGDLINGYLTYFTKTESVVHPGSSRMANCPDSKVHGANIGPTWVLSAPDGPHVRPMNLAIRVLITLQLPASHKHGTRTQKIIVPANVLAPSGARPLVSSVLTEHVFSLVFSATSDSVSTSWVAIQITD